MTENHYYQLLALIRRQGRGQEPLFLLALAKVKESGGVSLTADGEAVALDFQAEGLPLDAEHDGTLCLCLRLDGKTLALCILQ